MTARTPTRMRTQGTRRDVDVPQSLRPPDSLALTKSDRLYLRNQALGGYPGWAQNDLPKYHHRFLAADCAFLAAGEHHRQQVLPPMSFDPLWKAAMGDPISGKWQEDRSSMFQSVCDLAALADRAYGCSTVVLHCRGTVPPNSLTPDGELKPGAIRCDAWFPPVLLNECPSLETAANQIAQVFGHSFGAYTAARWTHAAKNTGWHAVKAVKLPQFAEHPRIFPAVNDKTRPSLGHLIFSPIPDYKAFHLPPSSFNEQTPGNYAADDAASLFSQNSSTSDFDALDELAHQQALQEKDLEIDRLREVVAHLSLSLNEREVHVVALEGRVNELEHRLVSLSSQTPSTPKRKMRDPRSTPQIQSPRVPVVAPQPQSPRGMGTSRTFSPLRGFGVDTEGSVSSVSSVDLSETTTFGGRRFESPAIPISFNQGPSSLAERAGIPTFWERTLEDLLVKDPRVWKQQLELMLKAVDVEAALDVLQEELAGRGA